MKNFKFQISNFKLKKGFTLIELLVVFSIVAVLVGIGFVSLAGYSRNQTLSQAAAEIKQAVETMFPGVTVLRVNTMRMPGKERTLRTRRGMFRADARPWKKAIVTLAEGQTIPELQA